MRQLLQAAMFYCAVLPAVFAQGSAPSHIDHVTLYAGAAEITRIAPVNAGSSYVEFDCIPKTFIAESMRAAASSAGSRIGDIRVDTLTATRAKACRHSPEEDRVRSLEDQRAAAAAEKDANEQVADYIKARSAAAEKQNAPDAKSFTAFIDGLRQTAQSTFVKRQALDRKLEDLDIELKTALQERNRIIGDAEEFVAVRVAVQAKAADDVRLIYSTSRAGWGATYRANLDSTTDTVVLERDAQVAQTTGEPWSGVRMTLSTGQPTRTSASGPLPSPRSIGYLPPVVAAVSAGKENSPTTQRYAMPLPAPAAPMMVMPAPRAKAETPLFDINAFQGTYATSFELGGVVTLPADGQKVTLSLGVQTLTIQLVAQSVPQSGDTRAYVVASAGPLAGIWPRGNLQVVRDGASVATLNNWQAQTNEPFSMSFGPDELVIVSVDPSLNTSAGAGFFGDSVQRDLHAHYTVTNRHVTAVNLQILESSPVSTNDKVVVVSHFSPEVSIKDWQKRPGVVAWDARVEAGATVEYRADYTVTAPKEGTVTGL